jgi:hypothetical protein
MQDSAGSSGLSRMNGTPGGSPRPLISLGDDRLILILRPDRGYAGHLRRYLLSGRMPWPPSVVPRLRRGAMAPAMPLGTARNAPSPDAS